MLPTLFGGKGQKQTKNAQAPNQVILNKHPSSSFLKQAKLSLTCSCASFACMYRERQNVKVETAECDSRNTFRIRNLGLSLNFATEQII